MALNNIAISIFGRTSKGGNVIGHAAYNARDRLKDERTGTIFNFRREGGLEWQGIFAPNGAPGWAKDLGRDPEKLTEHRQCLWNLVEKAEDRSTRPDEAQLARDFKIALPHELNAEQRRWLITDFARELSRKGMIVDVAIHKPDRHGDQRNFHAHILTTMRYITPEGFGNKVRAWNKKEEHQRWIQRWSELGSRALERAGFHEEAARFLHGHRTLREQRKRAIERGDMEWAEALDREPKRHLGPQASAMERRGKRTRNGEVNKGIDNHNRYRRQLSRGAKRVGTLPGRATGAVAESLGNAVASLFGPALTPEEQREADKLKRSQQRQTADAAAIQRESDRLARDREPERDR